MYFFLTELDAFNRRIKYFKCDFCPSTLYTENDFNSHALEHFEKKNCVNCDKLTLRIGSKWYELHIDDIKINESEDNNENEIGNEFIDTVIKVEDCENDDVEFNGQTNAIEINSLEDESKSNATQDTELDDSDEYQPKIDKKVKRIPKGKRKTPHKTDEKNADQNAGGPIEANKTKRKRHLCRIKCRICERNIWNFNFENHLQKMHVPNVIVTKEKLKCETCGKLFANNGSLKTHQTTHSATKRFGKLNILSF